MSNPSGEIKGAKYTDLNGYAAGRNVLLHIQGKPLLKFPDDVVGAAVAPLVFVVSLGRYSGSFGLNTLVINGAIAAVAKWGLEWIKIRQMEGRPIGVLGMSFAETMMAFLSRTCVGPLI